MVKLKTLLLIETIIILLLIGVIISQKFSKTQNKIENPQSDLLSLKITSGIMKDKSYAIVNFAPLRKHLEEHIGASNISIYVENLRNGAYMGIGEKVGYTPASLNKLPLAILIMRKIEDGKLSLDTPLKVQEGDRLRTFGSLYNESKDELPLKVVLEKMIKESDNTAMSILLHYVSQEDIDFLVDYYNLDIQVDFLDPEQKNRSNLISPKSMSNVFLSLYFSTILESDDSAYLLSLMENTIFDVRASANIPETVRIAHKFGQIDFNNSKFFHDCGIMYINESRMFYCIMTKGLEKKDALENIAYIVRNTYKYVELTKEGYKKFS